MRLLVAPASCFSTVAWGGGGTAPRPPSSRVFAGVLPALVTAQALRPEGSPLPVEWGHVKMWGGTGPSD